MNKELLLTHSGLVKSMADVMGRAVLDAGKMEPPQRNYEFWGLRPEAAMQLVLAAKAHSPKLPPITANLPNLCAKRPVAKRTAERT